MAGSVIGALRVTLGLDSAQFQTGAKKATGTAQKLASTMQKVGAALSLVGAGITAALKSQLNAADEAGKAAQRIGIPVEALTRLRFAADLSGVSAEQLETAVTRLSRQMVESAEDFNAIGVAIRDANGEMRPTVDVLSDLSDVFASMPDGAEKTALAVQLLGRSGASMIPLLNGGSAALRAMMKEADDLGVTISEETFRAAEVFNDSITRIQTALTALVRQITADLAPTMARIAETLAEFAASFARISPEVRTFASVLAGVTVVAGPLALAIGTVIKAFLALRVATLAFTGPVGIAFALIAAGAGAFLLLSGNAEKVPPPIDEARTALALLNETMGTFSSAAAPSAQAAALNTAVAYRDQAAAAIQAAEAELALMEAELARQRSAPVEGQEGGFFFGGDVTREMESQVSSAQAEINSLRASLDMARSRIRQAAGEITSQMGPAMVQAGDATQTLGLELDGVNEVLAKLGGGRGGGGSVPDLTAALEEVPTVLERVEQGASQVQDTFASTFADIVTGATTAREALSALASSLANTLAQSAGRSLFGALAGGIGLPGFATGTPYASGGLAMVGERGPELVNLPRGSRVFNAAETRRMGSDGVVVSMPITIDARGAQAGVAEQVNAALARRIPDIQRAAVAAVQNAGRRGY